MQALILTPTLWRNNLKQLVLVVALTAFVSSADIANSSLPPALLGNAGPLQGERLNYYKNAAGYLAAPQGAGLHGSVILIHEWNGLTDRIREVADAMAVKDISHLPPTYIVAVRVLIRAKTWRLCVRPWQIPRL